MEPRTTHRRVRWTHILGIMLLLNGMSAAATLPVERQFPAPGDWAEGMTFVGADLWIWDIDLPNLFYVVDPDTGAVKASYPSPPTGGTTGLAYDGVSLWGVSAYGGHFPFMAKFSPIDGSVISYYDVPIGSPQGITYDGQYLWVCGNEDGSSRIISLDPITMQPVREFVLPVRSPRDLAWDGVNLWMGASDWLGPGMGWREHILQIDPLTGDVLGDFDVPGGVAIGLAWDNGLLYVSDLTRDTIFVLRVPEPASITLLCAAMAFLKFGPVRREARSVSLLKEQVQ